MQCIGNCHIFVYTLSVFHWGRQVGRTLAAITGSQHLASPCILSISVLILWSSIYAAWLAVPRSVPVILKLWPWMHAVVMKLGAHWIWIHKVNVNSLGLHMIPQGHWNVSLSGAAMLLRSRTELYRAWEWDHVERMVFTHVHALQVTVQCGKGIPGLWWCWQLKSKNNQKDLVQNVGWPRPSRMHYSSKTFQINHNSLNCWDSV